MIIKRVAIGCQDWDYFKRLLKAAADNDKEAGFKLMKKGIQAGTCILWKVGDQVRSEDVSVMYDATCLVPVGSAEKCYWTVGNSVH